MALLTLGEEEFTGVQFATACFLGAAAWETPEQTQEQTVGVRLDRVGQTPVTWQATPPRTRGAETAYPLMLAAMRAVLRRTRRQPPFVTIADLSTRNRVYIEVARIDAVGITRQPPLTVRSPGTLARAVERLTTDDAEPIFYLGSAPFPAGEQTRLGALVLSLAEHPAVLGDLLLSGINPRTALRLVLLTATQRTAALTACGVGLWLWSAGQWMDVQRQFDRYGSGLLATELQPLKAQLRTLRSERDRLAAEFERSSKEQLHSTALAVQVRRALAPGARIERFRLDEKRLSLSLTGEAGSVLASLANLGKIGPLGNLSFSVAQNGTSPSGKVSVPVAIELSKGGRRGRAAQ